MRADLKSMPTGVAGQDTRLWPAIDMTASALMAREAREKAQHHQDAAELARREMLDRLEEATSEAARTSTPTQALEAVSESGMSWRDLAAVVGVSVPAVSKWRRGEGVSQARRREVFRVAALLTLLHEEHGVADPVSWLETPLLDGVMVEPMALLRAQRTDLVLSLAATARSKHEIEQVLSEFDPGWRQAYVDDDFEVVIAHDGLPVIRPRSGR